MKRDFETPPGLNEYFDPIFNIDAVKILPGDYHTTDREIVIVTVLGSCVSACIRDPLLGIGGMNHFMLPHERNDGPTPVSSAARYGTYAMEVLINDLVKRGGRRERFEVKLFGGGRVIKGFNVTNVGERNARFATEYMKLEGLKVAASDLLDDCPRKVYFFPRTGRVLVKKLRRLNNDTIARREEDYETRLARTRFGGDVELFS
ncbi:MAG TPA: chemoreceptor glutamine deamidase CheD [Aromatoleum sp.]|uniref:chemoreceptor glutamine deamidase CheD n=1 Tax=Aromatoleum sp. TaxID=2307007 RepID=UPI002B49240B|nr:chemoreceptor glutamine deamidase CheD [Aromatoleum sp.]HJV28103.1 chemoreceptor glutamine deamidase CheD [Aromatoleum sp.]